MSLEFELIFEEEIEYSGNREVKRAEVRRKLEKKIREAMDDRAFDIRNVKISDSGGKLYATASVIVEAGSGFWSQLHSRCR